MAASAAFAGDDEAPPAYENARCAQCHGGLTTKKYLHSHLKDGYCADCHVSAERPTECKGAVKGGWLLKKQEPDLCVDCHDLAAETPMHKPISVRGCTACHDAHGSDQKKNLLMPKEKLCLKCHERPDEGRVVHTAVREGNCLGCHDAHSGLDKPLLRDDRAAICDECHDKAELSEASHKDAKQACLGCHAVHSSDTDGLLRDKVPHKEPSLDDEVPPATFDDKQCLTCHEGILAKKFRHSFFKDGTCGECHLPSDDASACKGVLQKGWRLRRREPDLCAVCHDKTGDTPMHHTIGMRGCTQCHDAHSSEVKKVLKAPPAKLCAGCHRSKDVKLVTHTAVKEGSCVGCHEPHSGVTKPLLRDEKKLICDECHDKADHAPGKVVHTAVNEMRCLECHDPHGSDFENSLVAAPGTPLCMTCHDAKKPYKPVLTGRRLDLTRAVVHEAIPKEGCESCHEAGHSGSRKLLLKKVPPELCYECHDRKDGHEFTHGAVKLGDCTTCHAPHSSKNKQLLRADTNSGLCFQCHEDDLTGRAFVHRPAGEGKCDLCHDSHGGTATNNLKLESANGGCLDCHYRDDKPEVTHLAHERYGCVACHDPHGTATAFQVLKPVNELCVECHEEQKDGFHVSTMVEGGHPVKASYDARRDRDFTCASCHNPHGSKAPKLFYFGTNSLDMCEGCHGDHSGKHPELKDLTHEKKNGKYLDGGVPPVAPTMKTRPDAGEYPAAPPDAGVGAPDGGVPAPKVAVRNKRLLKRPARALAKSQAPAPRVKDKKRSGSKTSSKTKPQPAFPARTKTK